MLAPRSPTSRSSAASWASSRPTASSWLGNSFNEVKAAVQQRIDTSLEGGGMVTFASDGWKRRSAVGGAPLVNFIVLLPDGGSIFHDVIEVGIGGRGAQRGARLHAIPTHSNEHISRMRTRTCRWRR